MGSSIYIERSVHAALPAEVAESGTSETLAVSLIKSLARGIIRLDAETPGEPSGDSAELQPLLAAKGVALATDTQDYMIPAAVDLNAKSSLLSIVGGAVAIILALAGAAIGLRGSSLGRGRAIRSRS